MICCLLFSGFRWIGSNAFLRLPSFGVYLRDTRIYIGPGAILAVSQTCIYTDFYAHRVHIAYIHSQEKCSRPNWSTYTLCITCICVRMRFGTFSSRTTHGFACTLCIYFTVLGCKEVCTILLNAKPNKATRFYLR